MLSSVTGQYFTRLCNKMGRHMNRFMVYALIYILHLITVYNVFVYLNVPEIEQTYVDNDNNISCYFMDGDNVLPVTSDGFFPDNNSIFFHETSCSGGLTSTQACAVEAVARLHPERKVHVLFNSPITSFALKHTSLLALKEFPNIVMTRLKIADYLTNTKLEYVVNVIKEKSNFKMEHTSHILRLVTLLKYGGTFLDTDFLVVKNLNSLATDWAVCQSRDFISIDAITISKDGRGRKIILETVEYIKTRFKSSASTLTSIVSAFTNIIAKYCRRNIVPINRGIVCQDFTILNPETFYPIFHIYTPAYFKTGYLTPMKPAIAHHIWSRLSSHLVVEKDSPYDRLAREFCPTVYSRQF